MLARRKVNFNQIYLQANAHSPAKPKSRLAPAFAADQPGTNAYPDVGGEYACLYGP